MNDEGKGQKPKDVQIRTKEFALNGSAKDVR
jgi:hypothetical protein